VARALHGIGDSYPALAEMGQSGCELPG